MVCAFAAAGCSYQLSSLNPIGKADPDQTGSIGRPAERSQRSAKSTTPSEFDLVYARAAVTDALAHGAKDSSAPWENPHTGARGNVTPLPASYIEDGSTCRDFLASYAQGDTQTWLKGAACRKDGGKWEVKSLQPLQRG